MDLNHIVNWRARALKATALHGTDENSELDRIAREHGHRGWQAFMATCEPAVLSAERLMTDWNLPVDAREASWRDARFFPAFNPLEQSRLPHDPASLDSYLRTIVEILIVATHQTGNAKRFPEAPDLMVAMIKEEIGLAEDAGRHASLVNVALSFRSLEQRIPAVVEDARRRRLKNVDAWEVVLRDRIAEFRSRGRSELAAAYDILLRPDGRRAWIMGTIDAALLMFRNPHVITRVG